VRLQLRRLLLRRRAFASIAAYRALTGTTTLTSTFAAST